MANQMPNRDAIEIDPRWAAIVLPSSSRREARRWLSTRAPEFGLTEAEHLEPKKERPALAARGRKGSGQVRIDQTLTFRVDDACCADDGRLTVRQSFELAPDSVPADEGEDTSQRVAQNPRVVWLRGKDALTQAVRLAKALDGTKLGRAAAVPAFYLKDVEHRYAVDPWMVEIRPNSRDWKLPPELRQDFEAYDDKKPVYGGKWIAARFRDAETDSPRYSRRFRERVGKAADLAFRALPLTVRVAAVPSDLYYTDGPPPVSPGQDEPFGAIGLPAMWAAIAPLTKSTVHVFLFDLGADSHGPDVYVNDEVSVTAIGMPPGVPLPMGEWSPWGGALHGRWMASVMGASWAVGSPASMAGIFGHVPQISVVSVRCQSLPEMAAGLDHVAWFMKSDHPAKPTKAVAVFGHDVLWACKVARASPDPAVAAQVMAFEDALEEAQVSTAGGPDVLTIFPVGNFALGSSPTIPNSFTVGASSLLVGACGLPSQNTRWIGSRWADTGTGPKPSLLAPGQSILACSQQDVYVRPSGTSIAAAHVAGVAALLRSVQPTMSALQIADLVRNTATPLPLTPVTTTAAAGTPDPQSGKGRLNAGGLLPTPP